MWATFEWCLSCVSFRATYRQIAFDSTQNIDQRRGVAKHDPRGLVDGGGSLRRREGTDGKRGGGEREKKRNRFAHLDSRRALVGMNDNARQVPVASMRAAIRGRVCCGVRRTKDVAV